MPKVTNYIKIMNTYARKMGTTRLTPEGYEKMVKRQQELQEKRKKAVLTLKQARELGDLSENGFYKAARFELTSIDGELRRIAHTLKFSVVVTTPDNGMIGIGSTVTLRDNTIEKIYTIVGNTEADPKSGKVSDFSPIGKALIGRKAGDTVEITTPSGILTYTITNVD